MTHPSPDPGSASVIDHIGPPRHPHRVTIIRLARARETYELRWRENVRDDHGVITRARRTTPGGNSKALAYKRAEKVWRNLDRTGGYHGTPPATAATPAPAKARTLRQVADLWLAQHPAKLGTVEGYTALMNGGILPALPTPAGNHPTTGRTRPTRHTTRHIELGAMIITDIRPTDINTWLTALAAKPDARRRDKAVPISPASVQAHLRVLKACLNWALTHGYLDTNPAARATVTVHGRRQPEWFRTPQDFWTVLDHIDTLHNGSLHDAFITAAYLGLRINELAALQRGDVDLHRDRVNIRHNFDNRGRPSTVKSEESETWLPLHPEAKQAIRNALNHHPNAPDTDLIFHGPRGGTITSTLINDALTHGCHQAGLNYRVTAHGLRHSFANWLKTAGVPTRDIQTALRHRDQRTTNSYLHTSDHEKATAINLLPGRPQPSS